ncbi:MAG: RNA methyltransferase [Desulfovibrio sp.]|jgi:tRNA (guanosine-2'-O-)-methyltransferase|nr:RNA methyltransferase [Desulfovibrio sp.]
MPSTRRRTAERVARIRQVLGLRRKDLTLVLNNIHDPHNVSAILRSCDAFGVPEVHLYYTDTPFPALAAGSSASARKWVKTVRHRELSSLTARLRAGNMHVYAASCSASAVSLYDLDLTLPAAFVLGNEHRGLNAEFAVLADAEVCIPMYGMIQSFNVSVAAALLLGEASRQKKAAGQYARPTYSQEELAAVYAEWIEK